MSTAKTALIIGASRGLGLGLVKTLLADGWQVTATVRNPQGAEALQALGKVRIEKLDMDDQQAVIALSQQLKGEVKADIAGEFTEALRRRFPVSIQRDALDRMF